MDESTDAQNRACYNWKSADYRSVQVNLILESIFFFEIYTCTCTRLDAWCIYVYNGPSVVAILSGLPFIPGLDLLINK